MTSQGVEDLGRFDDPLLIFGGAYGNLQATQAMLVEAEKLGIPSQRVICNGDSVAYCAQPQETVDLIQSWGIRMLLGNCEESLASARPDCGCGFDPGTACSLLADDWYGYCSDRLDREAKSWMGELPPGFSFRLGELRMRLVHGGVSAINHFIFASTASHTKLAELALCDADVVIGGHAGLPFGESLQDRYWLNSGAIGMPANDGTRDGWYLLLSPTEAGVRCQWRRLAYDAVTARRMMLDAGLDNGYAKALSSGLWPSMDVLPAWEAQQQGRPLQPPDMIMTTEWR